MWGRRIGYLAILLSCLVFYLFYQKWFSWILLLLVLILPWLSLVVSLPAMFTVKASLRCPERARQDMPVRTALRLESFFPTSPVRCTIRLVNHLTGASYLGQPGEKIPTEHCGMITVSYPYMYVYDYLGLFRRRLKREETCTVYVEPKPVPTQRAPQFTGKGSGILRPKPGGGFSEVHDLRLYRPGDNLRQIHWKMSAKTGRLIYREPMEPVQKGYLLTATLSGSPQVLDKKLGQLLWLSQTLLERQQDHEILCQTGKGTVRFPVTDAATLEAGLHRLLASPRTEGELAAAAENVLWNYHIGGGDGEA